MNGSGILAWSKGGGFRFGRRGISGGDGESCSGEVKTGGADANSDGDGDEDGSEGGAGSGGGDGDGDRDEGGDGDGDCTGVTERM